MPITIITDGSADLPVDIVQQWGVRIVPLHVSFEGKSFDLKRGNAAFYQEMKTHSMLPQTASPSPYDFLQIMEEHKDEDMLIITISSNLSSTYQHALLAADMLQASGYRGSCRVLDSKTASLGLGLLVYRAARERARTTSLDELADRMSKVIEQAKTYFSLDTLENVIKGGRLDRAKGAIATILNIKLVMQASEDGAVEVIDKVRGTPRAVGRLMEKLGEVRGDTSSLILGIAHSNCNERAIEFMKRVVNEYAFQEVVFSEMGPVIGTYAGEGGILMTFS
jgi:DegV family protein with EDD domain